MLKVVFTGPAFNSAGQSIVRSALVAACKGVAEVQKSMCSDTDLLVASRDDTVKARKAAERGVKVVTYPEFLARFLHGVEIATGGVPSKYTDCVNQDLLVPVFLTGEELVDIDVL